VAAIRKAVPGEGAELSALCLRSKAYWGYDAAFMARCAASLTVSEAGIAAGRVLVAFDAVGRTIGVAGVELDGGTADLAVMFVDPPAIGGGAGRALFQASIDLARSLGARRLTILADPNAASFYERMGARYLHDAPSDAIPGRTLPFYEYDLSNQTAPAKA
jgi:GNAT superfamily N-acetyltransferase